MGEWEEKLNSILGDQQAMGQIMALAHSLSGQGEQADREEKEEAGERDAMGLAEVLDGVDPELIRRGIGVLRGMQTERDRSAALLDALRPFLRQERQQTLDRAQQALRMTRLLRLAMGEVGAKEDV